MEKFYQKFWEGFESGICNLVSETPGVKWAVIVEVSKHHKDRKTAEHRIELYK